MISKYSNFLPFKFTIRAEVIASNLEKYEALLLTCEAAKKQQEKLKQKEGLSSSAELNLAKAFKYGQQFIMLTNKWYFLLYSQSIRNKKCCDF